LRLAAGVALVLGVSLIAQRIAGPEEIPEAALAATADACSPDQENILIRWMRKLWQLSLSTIPVYVLAVLALGAARVWLFPHIDGAMGHSLLWLAALTVAGTLFMIPTAAEIPIVQSMLSAGLAMAPAVALLMTLPSISLPSLLMLRKSFNAKVLVTVTLLTMLIGAITGLVGAQLL
jgi:hypothetical protein